MAPRRIIAFLALAALLLPGAAARAQDPGPVDVLDVTGLLDERAVEWMIAEIEASDAQLVIVQLDSPGAISGRITDLVELVADPPVPLAVWIGPAPAVAHGGAAQLLLSAPVRAAAPGAKVGYLAPTVAGGADDGEAVADRLPEAEDLVGERVEIEASGSPYVDFVVPSIGQFVVGLDGLVVPTASGPVALDTAREVTRDDGVASVEPVVEVRFAQPDLYTRTLRLGVRPEAAYFFLVAGIALGVFEFYAAGAGLMAAVGVVALLLAGYGLSVLPVRWWAVAAAVAGVLLYASDFQRGTVAWRSLLGTASLALGGLFFVDAAPQFAMRWWAVLLVMAGIGLFFGFGMTAVVRARFSTRTIGRERLVGRRGVAVTDFDPSGVVDVDGAEWRALATRAAALRPGDQVVVIGVSGIRLDVEPAAPDEAEPTA